MSTEVPLLGEEDTLREIPMDSVATALDTLSQVSHSHPEEQVHIKSLAEILQAVSEKFAAKNVWLSCRKSQLDDNSI